MTTAIGTYASVTDAKERLDATGNVTWSAAATALLTDLCAQVNAFIESYTGRVLAPLETTTFTIDGFDALENGRVMLFPNGICTLTKLEVAPHTGGTFVEIPTTDFFLRPTAMELETGWPYTEVWMTDIPTSGNTSPLFFPGFANVRLTGTFGWAAVPDEITDVALNLVIAKYRARTAGGGDVMTVGADGERTYERLLGYQDRLTLGRHRVKTVTIL